MLKGEDNLSDISFTTSEGKFLEIHQGIPPRPFIGLSEEAEGEILAFMDTWFDSGISEGVRHYKEGARVMSGSQPGILTAPIGNQFRVAGAGFGGRYGPRV
jgi:hypothetical protein